MRRFSPKLPLLGLRPVTTDIIMPERNVIRPKRWLYASAAFAGFMVIGGLSLWSQPGNVSSNHRAIDTRALQAALIQDQRDAQTHVALGSPVNTENVIYRSPRSLLIFP